MIEVAKVSKCSSPRPSRSNSRPSPTMAGELQCNQSNVCTNKRTTTEVNRDAQGGRTNGIGINSNITRIAGVSVNTDLRRLLGLVKQSAAVSGPAKVFVRGFAILDDRHHICLEFEYGTGAACTSAVVLMNAFRGDITAAVGQ